MRDGHPHTRVEEVIVEPSSTSPYLPARTTGAVIYMSLGRILTRHVLTGVFTLVWFIVPLHAFEKVEIREHLARAEHDARARVFGDRDGQARFDGEAAIQILQ